MKDTDKSLLKLIHKIKEREQRIPLGFKEFMTLAAKRPRLIFRNVFQVFHDMLTEYMGTGVDEYHGDPESINFACYDCGSLFEEGTDHPFFADRLFANRLISHVAPFRKGMRQNRIYIFEGPHGCGKSTFLNNLLQKFEQYTKSDDGGTYETVWRLNKKELGMGEDLESHILLSHLRNLAENHPSASDKNLKEDLARLSNNETIEVPCPSHDNPLLLVPKAYRRELFDELIQDDEFKQQLFSEKQYEWVFRDNPCTICTSLYQSLLDILDSPTKVFDMVHARKLDFNRRLGQGVSVFNPGDRLSRTNVLTNVLLQNQLNALFRDSNKIKFLYSRYANTNNGIYALMDIKAHNKERLINLHGIVSEGVHKVEDLEENVNSLFIATMNPEDRENIAETQSFADRITYIKVSYVLDYKTEVKIYKHILGEQIEKAFLPRVLENFAKVIVSTRLKRRSEGLIEWIGDPDKYRLYCDRNLQLLKMDIYTGFIPDWLSEEDRKSFTAKKRKKIISESEGEGEKGVTGRDSIKIFTDFVSTHAKKDKLITMSMVCDFFKKNTAGLNGSIPDGFLDSLYGLYNYTVLQEVKESLYFYNEERISREIQNYLFAVNFDAGRTEKSIFTGEEIDISEDFFEMIERRFLGPYILEPKRRSFRRDVQSQYAAKTLTQEILLDGKDITETQIYRDLYQRYVHNLKENVLDPFLKNDNFRNAIKDFGTERFKSYDKRIREDVNFLIKNLNRKYNYIEQGAKEVCMYVVDNNIASTFSRR